MYTENTNVDFLSVTESESALYKEYLISCAL